MAMPPTPQSPIPRMPSASVATIKSMFSFFRTAEMRRAFPQDHLLTNTDRGVFCTHGCNAGSQCQRSAYIRSAAFRLNDHLTACKITFHSGHGERSSRHFAQLIRLRTELFVVRLACSSIVNTFGGRNPSSPSSFLSSCVVPLYLKRRRKHF